MTYIEEMLSRALLVRNRTVPRDVVPPPTAEYPRGGHVAEVPPAKDDASTEAAQDLRALCETLVTHMPSTSVAEFVTDQVPEPRSALLLACVLQLTDTDDGARYWWQYAAGAGQPAAAYCLYLHHLALGERATAAWWHRQTDDVQPPPDVPVRAHSSTTQPVRTWFGTETGDSPTSILRALLAVTKYATRPRTAFVTELMAYVPLAVAAGYLRQPDAELPLPGAGFARKIRSLLATAASKPSAPGTVPGRPHTHDRQGQDFHQTASATHTTGNSTAVSSQMGKTSPH
ncbi:hypothetical protein ABZ770_42035 [Streptomyces sp. NPDC006654]|uniref:hypothetical protein n=1 Tax=Streptomyces sp. NPDC006654 TaxID=3156897 RepID=UPI00340688C1